MSVKLTNVWFVLILISVLPGALSIKKGYYTIIAPATVRSQAVFHVSFTLNDFHKPCWFNISLSSHPDRNKIYGLEGIEVKPGTTKLVELQAPSFKSSDYGYAYLEVFGYRGIISKDSEYIIVEGDQFWAFIQTNKAQYRPGESVKFRIICIDQLTRPAKLNEKITVEIFDDEENLIKNILDVKLVQGVFRSELQLSDYPNLGSWKIQVQLGKRQLAVKNFEVDRYVLPKFNVTMSTKKVSIEDDRMLVDIIACYFDGRYVRGNVSITVIDVSYLYPESTPTFATQFKINGRITLALDFKRNLHLKPNYINETTFAFDERYNPANELYKFDIEAIVSDDITEEQSRTVIEVGIYKQPYKIDLQAPKVFDSDPLLNIKVKVLIKDLDGNSIRDTETPIEIIVACNQNFYRNAFDRENFDIVRLEYKNQIGKDFVMIQVSNRNYSECYLYAKYRRSKSSAQWMKKKQTTFDMEILTESPQEGKELEIKITNSGPIEEFSYEIVSRGDIIQADYVNVPGNDTTCILRLNVTSSMVPKITVYAHLIRHKSFVGQMKDILIKKAFLNSIEITTTNATKPGSSVYINVTTDEGSYVGLMGLDHSVLQNLKKKSIFNEDDVNTELRTVNSLNFYFQTPSYGTTGDIITFSNVFPSRGGGFRVIGYGTYHPSTRTRKLFPESWLFMDFERTPAEGLNIMETAPDSITTWAITGFSIHPDTGLTFTKNTTNLKIQKEYFILMDLPSFVKEGEIIKSHVHISNTMSQDVWSNVTIESNSKYLDILSRPEAISSTKINISALILAKKIATLIFFLKPLKQGQYNVTVKAEGLLASDAIQKTLNVQAQGIPYAMSKTLLVHLPEESIHEDEITIDIPENVVPESQRVEVSVVGDIFGPLIRDIQKLARIPYGNCEENMRLIVSNSMVLKYLKVLNYSNPILESKIRRNIYLGYQNHLSFKFLDGSFGLFDQKFKRTGDIWHTVFSLWGLEQAKEFVRVDPNIIDRGLKYLRSKQQENGCLRSENNLEENVKFTAFGLMVFLRNELANTTYNEVIGRGLEFLYESTDDLEYSPVAVMAVYALVLGKYEKAGDQLKKLTSNSRLTSTRMLWAKSDTLQSHLESITTSLMNLLQSQEISDQSILNIVRGLIGSKEEHSIGHMLALQAMIAFVEKRLLTGTNMDMTFKDDQNESGDFRINAENSQVLQTFEISKSARKIKIQSKGRGFAVVDVRYNYNLVPENQTSSFYTTNISTNRTSRHLAVLKICSSTLANNTQNNLTIMEVSLQSGFFFTEKNYQNTESLRNEYIKSVQVNDSRDKAVVYFEIKANEACIGLDVRETYKVFNSKPGWIIVYGAHDRDHKATRSFRINDQF